MTDNLRGALLMMASMAAFTINDTFVKATDDALPLVQLLAIRGSLATVLIFFLARHFRALDFRIPRRDWGLVGLRCAAEVGAAYLFLTALLHMPLANITALLQALPLTVTLGAALVFGEAVGWKRMTAIGIGFAGMLLIVRPGTAGFDVYSLYGLAAVVCVTVRDLVTRRMSARVPSLTVTFLTSASVSASGALGLLWTDWVPLDARLAGLVGASSICIVGGYLFSVMVMRVGDVSFVAPFRYTGLVWALVLGWAVFGHWPEPATLLGAAIIVATGLFTLYRERAGLVPAKTRRT